MAFITLLTGAFCFIFSVWFIVFIRKEDGNVAAAGAFAATLASIIALFALGFFAFLIWFVFMLVS